MRGPTISLAALWWDAWLRGSASGDDLLHHLSWADPDAPTVAAIDGDQQRPLGELLSSARGVPDARVWLLLPRPGQSIGWPQCVAGAPEPAVLLTGSGGSGALLRTGRSGWLWDSCDASALALEATMLTARAGARGLAQVASFAAARLEALGVQRRAAALPPTAWQRAFERAPLDADPQRSALLGRLGALLDGLDLAQRDDGAAVTAGESRARSAELTAVIGDVEDIVAGVVNGHNVPRSSTVGVAAGLP